jgi:molybdopterin/thiamine biosynthesis adenylyltransferase
VNPWPERFPEYYRDHAEYWRSRGFEERRPDPYVVRFVGEFVHSHRPVGGEFTDRTFKVAVEYGPAFPYRPPVVRFIDADRDLKRSRHYLDGVPCLFRDDHWSEDAPATAVGDALRRWLRGYMRDQWDREIPLYELPEYYGYSPPTVFYASGALAKFSGCSGTFRVNELDGYEVAVLDAVDQQRVGRSILDDIKPSAARLSWWNGRWYRLSSEPPPMRNLRDVRAVLGKDGHVFRLNRRPRERDLLGLVFHDRALEQERLLLLDFGIRRRSRRNEPVMGWPVRAPAVYELSPDALFRRLEGIRDVARLGDQCAAIFGCGHIGSHIAEALAREGVGRLELLDGDRLAPGNVIRHALDLLSVGQLKAEALDASLGRINPWLESSPQTDHLVDPGVLDAVLGRANVLVGAIGDDRRETYLSEVAASHAGRPPLVVARTLHGGAAARIIVVRFGRDACLTCLARYKEQGHPDWIEVPGDELEEVYDDGCSSAARPGSGLAGQHAALLAARRVLDLLEQRDDDANHWLWVDRVVSGSDERLQQPGVLHTACFPPFADCPVCGDA